MIESWLQTSCDGCDDRDPAWAELPNTTRAELRNALHKGGWRSFGKLDYCPTCVKLGRHLKRESIYDSTQNA